MDVGLKVLAYLIYLVVVLYGGSWLIWLWLSAIAGGSE